MKNNPIRHHYIPQFVLRQFCYEDNLLWFKHKDTGVVESIETRDVFMEKNLYYFLIIVTLGWAPVPAFAAGGAD